MFIGEHEYKVDEKGRVPLPPKFRQELKDGAVLTKGVDKCIFVYTPAEWKKYAEALAANTGSPSKLRTLERFVFGSANDVILDGQGRVSLLPSLREHAGIGDSAVVVGANNRIEIWGKSSWDKEKALSEEQAWQISETLEAK